jgi:hypothetical protein
MRSVPRPLCVPIVVAIACFVLTLAGCGQGVRQDRSVTWSPEGAAVGFQHDAQGVYVADKEGGGLTKIFQPGPEVIATSTPLWSPTDRRLIFTTARDLNAPQGQRPQPPAEPNPAGDVFTKRPILYTCWLRDEPKEGQNVQPRPLFEAPCDHPGYVAANLAVRWHPRGDRILFVRQAGPQLHGLFEYDLRTGGSRQVLSQTAAALVFDWTPDGSHVACVLADAQPSPQDGIWIGKPGQAAWWHVPNSQELAVTFPMMSVLEKSRGSQPTWATDGERFAFVTATPGATQDDPGKSSLWLGRRKDQKVERLAEGAEPFHDLHWTPDGARLGFVRGKEDLGRLLIYQGGKMMPVVTPRPVRLFAGWNAAGDRLAYTAPDAVPWLPGEQWALLFPPDRRARDAVFVAPGTATEPGSEVFSGMRVTFPRWSPKEDKLSLWFTFSPIYRSLLSRLSPMGVPSGDPAAVFDVPTGRISWMAVSPFEEAQVGHYHLVKRQYDQAWRWYREAEAALPPAKPAAPVVNPANASARRGFAFFEYYCLSRMGQEDKARVKLEQFRQSLRTPALPAAPPPAGRPAAPPRQPPTEAQILATSLIGDMYVAEVFLSLGAADEGVEYFRRSLADGKTDGARLSSALVLAQLLLLEQKNAAYADLATDTVRPLFLKVGEPAAVGDPNQRGAAETESLRTWAAGMGVLPVEVTLLPMFSPEFLATLPEAKVKALLPRWQQAGPPPRNDLARLTTDLLLEAAYQKLGRKAEQQTAAARVQANPARAQYLPNGVAGLMKEVRQVPEMLQQLYDLVGTR